MESQQDGSRGKQRSSPPATSAQQEFLFVDAAKAKSSRQGRRSARSFVMQKARRERPWSTSKHSAKQRKSPQTISPTTLGTPGLSTTPNSSTKTPSPLIVHTTATYFPFADVNSLLAVKQEVCPECQQYLCPIGQSACIRCLRLQNLAPGDDVDGSLFDPFGTMAVDMNAEVSGLLEHFVTDMAPRTIAVDIRNKSHLMQSHWFSTAMSDPGFMHSLLCTAALHRYMGGRGSIETVLYHRDHAITAVNSAIKSPNLHVQVSDANVGAVFNLLTVEESLCWPMFDGVRPEDDHPNQRAIHLNGLRRMVQLRGGLMAMTSNRILHAFILWHSTAHAIASFEAPYLSTSDLISAACRLRRPPGYRPNISQHLLDRCKTARVERTLTTLVEHTLTLIADLNVWFGDVDCPLDPLDIQNSSCALECMLLNWLRDNEHCASPLEDALCVALLIFTVRTTEALKLRSDIHMLHFAASKKLEKALSATSRTEWQSCPELLLWILAIGAISAQGSTESSWFVYQASLACSEFGIHCADSLLDRLHLCGWVSFKLDEAVRQLWENITDLRLEPCLDEAPMVGPLQCQVASPEFTDWQNIDWSDMGPLNVPSGSLAESSMGGLDGLYEFGSGYTFPHNSAFYVW